MFQGEKLAIGKVWRQGACKGTQREEQQGVKKLAEGPGWKLLE